MTTQIAKAVEAEVTRRLEERERERARKEEGRREEEASHETEAKLADESRSHDVSSGAISPVRRNADLDIELKKRLEELEQKLCVVLLCF